MTASMCVCISVLVHLVFAVMLSLRIIMLKTETEEIKKNSITKEEIVIEIQLAPVKAKPQLVPPMNAPLTPEELKALAANTPPVEKPEETPQLAPKPKELTKFQRTSDDQLAGKAPDTNIQGERDTLAASNANPLTGAPDKAAVRGEKPKDGIEEKVDTTFQDGVLEQMNKGGEVAKAEQKPPVEEMTDPTKIADVDQEEIKSSVESTKEVGEELEIAKLAATNKEKKEFLETQKKMALNEDLPSSKNLGEKEESGQEEQNKTIANNQTQPDPDAMKQKPQEEKQKNVESQPKTAENKKASDNGEKGFRSEAKATVMEGTISRRSKIASDNVKATPVGKYMAEISKLVEKEWQRRCMMHADLIQPGTLRIGFMVDENGKVNNVSTISQTLGSENQRSLTFQALNSVKIPPMPKEVRESQGGDPLEFRYYFRFQ